MGLFRRAGAEILRILQVTSDPAAVAGQVSVYGKDSGGTTKLFMRDGAGTVTEVGGGGNPTLLFAAGRASHVLDTPPLIAGAFEFNRSTFTSSTITFRAVAAKGSTVQANVQLYNVTDAVSVDILNFTSTATALQISGDITGSLPTSSKIYEVRIYLDAPPGGGDSVELYSAALEINQ